MQIELTRKQIQNLLLCAQYANARIWNIGNCAIQASVDYSDSALNNAIVKLKKKSKSNYYEMFEQ